MFGLEKNELPRRDWFVFPLARLVSNTGFRILSRTHIECARPLKEIKKDDRVILFAGLHKSLWETSGVLSAADFQKIPIPYIGMGDNLVRGHFYQRIAGKMGAFLVKRATSRKRSDIVASAKKLKQFIMHYMASGIDVVIFPEGTRRTIPEKGVYGPFFPTAFEALLEYERTKDDILKEYPKLVGRDIYVVPFNVDYSRIREDYEMVGELGKKPRTLKVYDSVKMLGHLGDIYVSFGEAVKVADRLHMNRKQLAQEIRGHCLDLVKVLPINVVSRAVWLAIEEGKASKENALEHIPRIIETLQPVKERFRCFTGDEQPGEIFDKVSRMRIFSDMSEELLPYYKLYANYIHHYLGLEV